MDHAFRHWCLDALSARVPADASLTPGASCPLCSWASAAQVPLSVDLTLLPSCGARHCQNVRSFSVGENPCTTAKSSTSSVELTCRSLFWPRAVRCVVSSGAGKLQELPVNSKGFLFFTGLSLSCCALELL